MEAKKVHHLVHIGYDPREHPDFEEKICSLISDVSERSDEIISFVDIPDSSIEQPNKARRIVDLDLFMSDYFAVLFNIYLFRRFWTPLNQQILG
jgi:hypothetical protein